MRRDIDQRRLPSDTRMVWPDVPNSRAAAPDDFDDAGSGMNLAVDFDRQREAITIAVGRVRRRPQRDATADDHQQAQHYGAERAHQLALTGAKAPQTAGPLRAHRRAQRFGRGSAIASPIDFT